MKNETTFLTKRVGVHRWERLLDIKVLLDISLLQQEWDVVKLILSCGSSSKVVADADMIKILTVIS